MKLGRKVGTTNYLPLLDRLLNLVVINKTTDCWEWQGGKNNIGYGLIRDGNKMRTVHRVSYEEHNNVKIPKYKCVCHTCDNMLCVNPAHLWIGSQQDNMQDMVKKDRHRFGGDAIKKQPLGKCIHCGTIQPVNTLARYHNNNCPNKSINKI